MRTPTVNAASVVARFPQGRLLVVPGVGHSTTTADPSGCAANAVRSWFQNGAVPLQCPRGKPIVRTVPGLPAPTTGAKLGARATYAIAAKTLLEAQAGWLMANDKPLAGVYSGKLVPRARGFTLTRYSVARGVQLSGTFKLVNTDLPFSFQGTVTVTGAVAAQGILGLYGDQPEGHPRRARSRLGNPGREAARRGRAAHGQRDEAPDDQALRRRRDPPDADGDAVTHRVSDRDEAFPSDRRRAADRPGLNGAARVVLVRRHRGRERAPRLRRLGRDGEGGHGQDELRQHLVTVEAVALIGREVAVHVGASKFPWASTASPENASRRS